MAPNGVVSLFPTKLRCSQAGAPRGPPGRGLEIAESETARMRDERRGGQVSVLTCGGLVLCEEAGVLQGCALLQQDIESSA